MMLPSFFLFSIDGGFLTFSLTTSHTRCDIAPPTQCLRKAHLVIFLLRLTEEAYPPIFLWQVDAELGHSPFHPDFPP